MSNKTGQILRSFPIAEIENISNGIFTRIFFFFYTAVQNKAENLETVYVFL